MFLNWKYKLHKVFKTIVVSYIQIPMNRAVWVIIHNLKLFFIVYFQLQL